MTIPEPPGFAALSKSQQIEYLQHLWDLIADRADDVPVPESHLALAEERLAAHRKNPHDSRSAFAMLDQLSTPPA